MTSLPTLRYPGQYVAHNGAKPAVVIAETGETVTYAELDTYAMKLGQLYRQLGLQAGDHVAYCVEGRIECPGLQWGAHYAGLYYSFISSRLTPTEICYIVSDCDAQVLVVSATTAPGVIDALKAHPNPPKIFTLDAPGADLLSLPEALAACPAELLPQALEGSMMLYSSGTTGRPKGVKPVLTGKPLGSTDTIADLMKHGFGVTDASVYLSAMPYYHAASMRWFQGINALGGTAILMKKFDAEGSLSAIEKYGVTHAQFVPTMFHRMLGLPAEVRQKYNLSSLKVVAHAGAPCPIPTKQSMIEWVGPILVEYYSCTEMIGSTLTDSKTSLSHPGTVGRPVLGKVHIVGENGEELPAGQEGLIYFADGPRFTYHKDEEKTRTAYNAQGWATVGDIGKVDEEGYLYLTDRKNHMIISGGVNVYPQETENVLITHPKVYDVAVIGIPDPDLGEKVCAVVQLQPGTEPTQALRDELQAYCRAQLSPIKTPKQIDFRSELPREPTGKLLKRKLRDEYQAQHAEAAQ